MSWSNFKRNVHRATTQVRASPGGLEKQIEKEKTREAERYEFKSNYDATLPRSMPGEVYFDDPNRRYITSSAYEAVYSDEISLHIGDTED